jgi:hypothetical protein
MPNFVKSHGIALLLALLSTLFYVSFAYDLVRSDFIELITLFSALFFLAYKIIQISKGHFWILVGIGIVFRLVFIAALPNLSQDFYRFIWDGRLLLQGFNPYLFAPQEFFNNPNFSFDKLGLTISEAEKLYADMGELNASHFSNYPPVNQLFFLIAALFAKNSIFGSVIILKLIMILADLGILYFGRKLLASLHLDPKTIFWYFLNPFIIIELTGNLHFEGVMLFFVVWSLYLLQKDKWFWAAILLGVSISVKLIPILFLPLFYRWFVNKKSFGKRFKKLILFYLIVAASVFLAFLPFFSSEFISNYSATLALWFQDFEFNASIFYIIRWIGFEIVGWNVIETAGKILPLIVVVFVLVLSFFRKNKSPQQLITAMLFGISFYFLLSTTVHSWYITTPLLLSVFTKYRFPIVWSFVVMLSYSAYGSEGFSENLQLVFLEYTVLIGFAMWELFLKKPRLQKPIPHHQNT